MQAFLRRRHWRLAVLVFAGLVVAGGVAYATIPDGGGVYTACMLKNVGTIRLIDPSLPSTNLMSHCTALETQISWNQTGQQGPTGLTGAAGADGAQGPPGPAGNFSGHFQSPDGQYSIDVTDNGIAFAGPSESFTMNSNGERLTLNGDGVVLDSHGITLNTQSDVTVRAGNDVTVRGSNGASVRGGASLDLEGGATTDVKAGATLDINGGGVTNVQGAEVTLNGCSAPLALITDPFVGQAIVDPQTGVGTAFVFDTSTGATTVCAG